MTRSIRRILTLTTILLLTVSTQSFSQIIYQKTYEETLRRAKQAKKPIFLIIGLPKAMNGMQIRSLLDDENVAAYYNENFINYLVSWEDPALKSYIDRYKIHMFPTPVFLDDQGVLIMMSNTRNLVSAERYISDGNEAMERMRKGNTLGAFTQRYQEGQQDKAFLKDYIKLKIECGWYDNSALIDQYVNQLTIGELENYQEALFIHQAGPIAFGKAYKLAATDPKIVDSIYRNEPPADRVEMNNRIIKNTFDYAVATKNHNVIQNLQNFIRNTYTTNYEEGHKQATIKALEFYQAINDTASYFNQASRFYDQYDMKVSVEAIKKSEQENKELQEKMRADIKKAKANAGTQQKTKSGLTKGSTIMTSTITVRMGGDVTSTSLNNAAWNFYQMGTRNITLLSKALTWSLRSIEINPLPAYYDTLAHLFYRMGLFDEAILNQNKAIALSSKMTQNKQSWQDGIAELKKMKERSL